MLLYIFWKRFGTPTEDGTTGTEHEFLTAFNAWKAGDKTSPQIMLYFKQQPFMPQSIPETEQFLKVQQFQKNLPKECFYWQYQDAGDFERQARQHLTDFFRDRLK
ncbi:MAG: hypothetical protein HC890_00895 [Chloroflexaceae bacterium]|nr:hypothetical protein [Chloroflexaceae bacterium]